MRIQRSIDIAAPPEKIWPFLIEPEKIMKWFTLLREFEYTGEQRSGAGTTFYYKEKNGPVLVTLNYVVTEWVENEKFAFNMTSGPGKRDDQVWSIDPTPSGSRFTITEDFEMAWGIAGRIIVALIAERIIGKGLETIVTNLKGLVEAS